MELFAKIISGYQLLTIFAKISKSLIIIANLSILDVFGGPGYISTLCLMLQKEPPEVFYEKRCSEKFHKTLLKKRLWHWCFPGNFVKFLRTPFLQNTSGRLLLILALSTDFHSYIGRSSFENC